MGLEGIRATDASVTNANHHEETLRTTTQNNLFAHLGSSNFCILHFRVTAHSLQSLITQMPPPN